MTAGLAFDRSRRGSCLILALIAAGTFQVVRQSSDIEFWGRVADTAATIVVFVTVLLTSWRARPGQARHHFVLALTLTALLTLPLILEFLRRRLTADGEAFETVLLVCLRNAALGTAALGTKRRIARLSYALSGFLTLFSVSIADSATVYLPAALYAVVGLWNLMGAYWERLEGHLAVENRRQAPVRIGVLGSVCGLLAITAALVAGVRRDLVALPGFMPSSGGQQGSDPYARQGIGDGDMLAAAKNEAMSFGPVDSEQFLESEMPSLYDMLDDRYGEPTVKPRNVRRAVALSGRSTTSPKQTPSQSKRSGREFAAVRRKTATGRARPRDSQSTALFYVLGRVPLHLMLETYDAFDGARWSHEASDLPCPPLTLNNSRGAPWVEFYRTPRDWVLSQERHAVKIVNLQSPRYPSPPNLAAAHIEQINRADLFGWTPDGVLCVEGQEFVPQFTVIHLVSDILGAAAIRTNGFPGNLETPGSPYLQLPRVVSVADAKQLAALWTSNCPRGWPQVEAVIARLRSDFVHDNDALAPVGCEDVVGHFLATKRGPDYLFASTAAVLVRSLGFPARLVCGFYADSNRYDRRAGQTTVAREDAHVWVEVCISGGNWIPVEPTPGYEPPRTVQTWREWACCVAVAAGDWLVNHWAFVTVLAVASLIVIWQRRLIADAAGCAVWRVSWLGSPRRVVLATLWLLERRARLAGCSRPRNWTPTAWYGRLLPPKEAENGELFLLIDWVLYAPQSSAMPLPVPAIRTACRNAVQSASLRTLRGARKRFTLST